MPTSRKGLALMLLARSIANESPMVPGGSLERTNDDARHVDGCEIHSQGCPLHCRKFAQDAVRGQLNVLHRG
jgi:hypothetical protein